MSSIDFRGLVCNGRHEHRCRFVDGQLYWLRENLTCGSRSLGADDDSRGVFDLLQPVLAEAKRIASEVIQHAALHLIGGELEQIRRCPSRHRVRAPTVGASTRPPRPTAE
jgi:hypothetical protein